MEPERLGTAVQQERVIASLPVELRAVARHVLLGSFSKRGRPVGFHHAPGGRCPPGRRIDAVLERFGDGSYRARVSFWHPERGWVQKADSHTMFPHEWPSSKVVRAGLARTEAGPKKWCIAGGTRKPARPSVASSAAARCQRPSFLTRNG